MRNAVGAVLEDKGLDYPRFPLPLLLHATVPPNWYSGLVNQKMKKKAGYIVKDNCWEPKACLPKKTSFERLTRRLCGEAITNYVLQ